MKRRTNYNDEPVPTTLTPEQVSEVKAWLADAHRQQEAKKAARRKHGQPTERSAAAARDLAPRRICHEIGNLLTDDAPITTYVGGRWLIFYKPGKHDPVEIKVQHPYATVHKLGSLVLVHDADKEAI